MQGVQFIAQHIRDNDKDNEVKMKIMMRTHIRHKDKDSKVKIVMDENIFECRDKD